MSRQIVKLMVLPVVIFVLGAILSFFIWNYVRASFLKQSLLDFESRVGDVAQLVEARLNRDVYMLYGVRGVFASSDNVSRAEFDTYARSINFVENYPGVTGIAYQSLVKPEERAGFTGLVRNDKSLNGVGYPSFAIYPEPNINSSSLVINYIYPLTASNSVAFGFDVFSDPYRKSTAEKACDLNTAVVSGKVAVFPDKKDGFLITLPIYQNNTSTAAVAERREKIVGFVTASFVADHFFGSILSANNLNTK